MAARAARGAAALALAAGFVFSTARTVGDYFVRWGQGPDVFYAYDVALARVAAYANTLPEGEALYVTPTEREHYTLRFLLRRPYATFDGRAGRVYPPPEQAATVVVMVGEDRATLPALKRERRDGKVTWKSADPYGRPIATAYRLPAHGDPAPAPDRIAAATFGGAARLAGYSLAPADIGPGQPITLTLVWEALAPLPADYTVFAHLVGPPNPATGGPVWAGHDSQPDGGAYPTTAWRPGETILDVHRLAVPADLPPGEYEVEVGLYLLATLERLPGVGADGRPLRDQAAILDTLRIKGEARDAQ